ncbi:MAG TPA: type II toxin-antitoxin system VapC family toxin [Opitutaceae bacterium]|jgi:tRNA(fMet)-specific endonuclease VapC|nr:type II toxin-antitoxin system VapC family toxin [Opitutaceae bacterium]
MIYLPDTNAFSRYFRGRDEPLATFMSREYASLRLSAVVLAELEFGAEKGGFVRHRAQVDQLSSSVAIEPFTAVDAVHYGKLRTLLERRGEIIGPHDMLIAAQALRLGATVVTHNVREFRRVPRLKVEDWQAR